MGKMYKKAGKDRKSTTMKMDSAKEKKFEDIPEGLKKDTTTGFGVNIIVEEVEGKRLGGDISCKGGGAAIKGTDFKGVF